MFYFEHRTLETTKSACVIPEEYTKFATLAEAKAALLQLGHNKYAKVTKPKENLCIFFGPFQSIQSQALRQVLCGGTPQDLLEPTKYFRQVVGPPSSKGYIANNWTTYLRRLDEMGILGGHLFEQLQVSTVVDPIGHEGANTTDNDWVLDTSFHLRDIFWEANTIGFTFLILGKSVKNLYLFFFIFHSFFVCRMVVPSKCKKEANRSSSSGEESSGTQPVRAAFRRARQS